MTVMKQEEDTVKMKMRKLIFVALLATGCSSQDINKPYPKYIKPTCVKDTIMYCEGRHPDRMECVCVKRSALEREIRNLIF